MIDLIVSFNGLNASLRIRSHEVKAEGWLKDHDTLMSVFSAPNYLDTGGNKGAFLQLTAGPGGSLQARDTVRVMIQITRDKY